MMAHEWLRADATLASARYRPHRFKRVHEFRGSARLLPRRRCDSVVSTGIEHDPQPAWVRRYRARTDPSPAGLRKPSPKSARSTPTGTAGCALDLGRILLAKGQVDAAHATFGSGTHTGWKSFDYPATPYIAPQRQTPHSHLVSKIGRRGIPSRRNYVDSRCRSGLKWLDAAVERYRHSWRTMIRSSRNHARSPPCEDLAQIEDDKQFGAGAPGRPLRVGHHPPPEGVGRTLTTA